MKKLTKTINVPARTYERDVWVAFDGEEFACEFDCLHHERIIEMENHHIYKTCIRDFCGLNHDEEVILYHFRDAADHDYFVNNLRLSAYEKQHFTDDFNEPGWYVYYLIGGGDGPDFHHLYNFDNYLRRAEDELACWKASVTANMVRMLEIEE